MALHMVAHVFNFTNRINRYLLDHRACRRLVVRFWHFHIELPMAAHVLQFTASANGYLFGHRTRHPRVVTFWRRRIVRTMVADVYKSIGINNSCLRAGIWVIMGTRGHEALREHEERNHGDQCGRDGATPTQTGARTVKA